MAASGQVRTTLSRSWVVSRKHQPFFNGGKTALSASGEFLVCWFEMNVRIFDLSTGQVTRSIDSDEDGFSSFAVSPDDSTLITASTRSNLLKCWNMSTGVLGGSWKGHDHPVLDMVFDWSGSLLVTGSADRTVRVWNVSKQHCTHVFRGHNAIVMRVIFNPNPAKLEVMSCAEDGEIRVWDLYTKKCNILTNHMSAVTAVTFPPDSTKMISVSRDKVICIWDLAHYSLLKSVPVFEALEGCAMLSPDRFVTGGEKGCVKVWEVATMKCLATKEIGFGTDAIASIFLAPKVRQVVAVTQEHNFHFLNADSLVRESLLTGFNDDVLDIAFVDAGRVALASNSAQVRLVSLQTWSTELFVGHKDLVLSIHVSVDGSWLATSSKDRSVRLWKIEGCACVGVGEGHAESVGCVRLSHTLPSNPVKPMFMVSGSRDRTLKIWDCSELSTPERKLEAMCTVVGHDQDINTVAIAPGDLLFASGSQDKTIKLWNRQLEPIATLKGHRRGVWDVQFSPVDKVLASASGDKTIKVWSVTDFTCLKTFEGHSGPVLKTLFLNHGMQLLSCGADSLVKLWVIKTNECINSFDEAHSDKIWAMCLSRDEKVLLTGGADSRVNVWEDATDSQREEASEKASLHVLKEQKLKNLIMRKHFTEAAHMCIELDQPRRLLGVLYDMVQAEESLDDIVVKAPLAKLEKLVRYVREWNTNSRHAPVAHRLLQRILALVSPAELRNIPDIQELIRSMLLYAERHFARLDRLLQKSFVLDHTLHAMHPTGADMFDADSDSETEVSFKIEQVAEGTHNETFLDIPMKQEESLLLNDDDMSDGEALASNWVSDEEGPVKKSRTTRDGELFIFPEIQDIDQALMFP
jgi:U3 small nucleolar RNA-associated protein 13